MTHMASVEIATDFLYHRKWHVCHFCEMIVVKDLQPSPPTTTVKSTMYVNSCVFSVLVLLWFWNLPIFVVLHFIDLWTTIQSSDWECHGTLHTVVVKHMVCYSTCQLCCFKVIFMSWICEAKFKCHSYFKLIFMVMLMYNMFVFKVPWCKL